MERLYLYDGALAVIGLALGLPAARSLLAGDRAVPTLLLAFGGVALVVSAGYESLRTDPDEFTAPAWALFALVGAACLSLLGAVL